MIRVFVHDSAGCREAAGVDPAWLLPGSNTTFWVDLAAPSPEEGRILTDVFHFHELAMKTHREITIPSRIVRHTST